MEYLILIFLLTISLSLRSQENPISTFHKNTINGTFYGVVKNGKEILPAIYDEIGSNNKLYFSVKKNGKWGLVDSNNKTFVDFKYDLISIPSEGRFYVGKGEKVALSDMSGKLLTGFIFNTIFNFKDGLSLVSSDNFMGFIDKNGNNIIKLHPTDELEPYLKNGVLLIKKRGKESIAIANSSINGKSNDLVIDLTSSYFYVYNNLGKIVYKSDADEKVEIAKNGNIIAIKYIDGNYNLRIFNQQNKLLYKLEHLKNVEHIYEDEFINIHSGIINTNGIEIMKPNFDEITSYLFDNNKLARVYFKQEQKSSYMNSIDEREYFYIDKNFKCIEFESKKCPE